MVWRAGHPVTADPARCADELFAARSAQVVGGPANGGGPLAGPRVSDRALPAGSATMNPCGATARARTAGRVARVWALLTSTPPPRVAPVRAGVGGWSSTPSGGKPTSRLAHAGEAIEGAGDPGHDLGELPQHPAAHACRAPIAAKRAACSPGGGIPSSSTARRGR
jgi:hypothetical protein